MDMTMMESRLPGWLTPVAWTFLGLAIASAAVIAYDIYARGNRHNRPVDELVWLGSALYLGPFALVPYARHRRSSMAVHVSVDRPTTGRRPVAADGLPGGTASAIAHLIGVPLVIASGLTIAGIDLWVMILVIAVLAMALLFVYERAATGVGGPAISVGAAVAAAAMTVVAFDIGMGGWMILLHFNDWMPAATEASFWFLMQVGIVLGLITGYPVVAWLVRRGRSAAPLYA
jgi:ABC-type Co2+ transport system permease subunit